MPRTPTLAALLLALALTTATTPAVAMQPHSDDLGVAPRLLSAQRARRELIKSSAGLVVDDGWLAEVLGGPEACAAVAAEIEAWKLENLPDLGRSGEDARRIPMTQTCFVTFSGPPRLAQFVATNISSVASVEPDTLVIAEWGPKSWGLDRIDQEDLPYSQTDFAASHTGAGVNVYVLDTGINVAHVDFNGRARQGWNFVSFETEEDLNGHGSHCAGTASGGTYGVASASTVWNVKVLTANGAGLLSAVINGVQWAVQNQKDNFDGEPGVISMSLGGGTSQHLINAAKDADTAGMMVVVAAGNDGQDACKYAPAGAGGHARKNGFGVITVGATTTSDSRASYSNYGGCLDIFAPGSSITSTYKGGIYSTTKLSGTSMAAPHVAGAAAVLLEKHKMDKTAAHAELFAIAVADKVRFPGDGSPNLLLQVPTYTGPPTPPTRSPTMKVTAGEPQVCIGGTRCIDFAESAFGPGLPVWEPIAGPLLVASKDPEMCTATGEDFSGAVVVVKRGTCAFFDKVHNAELQGAAAVLIMQVTDETIFPPNHYGQGTTEIPSAMISLADGNSLRTRSGESAIVGPNPNTLPPTMPTIPPSTSRPSVSPTTRPSASPTPRPSDAPTSVQTRAPTTLHPTRAPSLRPTDAPVSPRPSVSPTTLQPSLAPTSRPTTASPTERPSQAPVTLSPSLAPTSRPTTAEPTARPSQAPTLRPTQQPVDPCEAVSQRKSCVSRSDCSWQATPDERSGVRCNAK